MNDQEKREFLAHRWLTCWLFVPPIIASGILLEGTSTIALSAMSVADFALNSDILLKWQETEKRRNTNA